jgi:hypothetical protein
MRVQQWVDAYARAWSDCDADAAAKLFTEDCLSPPHAQPRRSLVGLPSRMSPVQPGSSDAHA